MRHVSLLLSSLMVTSASSALAQAPIPLWKNGQAPFASRTCPKGQIPRGGPDGQDWQWKEYVRNYLKVVSVGDVDLGTPVPIPESFDDGPWMSPMYNTDTACMQDPVWNTLMPQVASQVEDVILHGAGEEWVDDGLVRMNLAPEHFILSELENTTTCLVHTPSYLQDPELTSWAHLSYDGNPYYSDAAIAQATLTRGAVWLGWNLLIWDYLSWTAGTQQGEFPCDPSVCAQPAAVISPATGLVIPTPGQAYVNFNGQTRTLTGGLTPVQYHEESGGLLASMAGTYLHVKHILSTPVQTAMETAFLRFADRIAHQPMWVNMANLNHRVLVALRLCEETQSSSADRALIHALYEQQAAAFYDASNGFGGIYQPQGTLRDVGGFDTGYNRFNLLHLARLAWMDGTSAPPALQVAANDAFDLWGHMMFPDPTVTRTILVSPSAFNSRTGKGAATGSPLDYTSLQGLLLAGGAGLPYAWAALAHTDWAPDAGAPWNASNFLFSMCSRYILHFHGFFAAMFTNVSGNPDVSFATPTPFPGAEGSSPARHGALSRAYGTPNFAFLFARGSGLLQQWATSAGTPIEELPFEHPLDDYYRNFDDAFFYAMPERADLDPDALVALVHAGPVAAVGGYPSSGYGGGELSTLWTQSGGPFWVARRRGNNGAGGDVASEWRELPLHAVSMADNLGTQWTGSGAVVTPQVSSAVIVDAPDAGDAIAAILDVPGACPPASLNAYPPVMGTTAQHVRVCGDIPVGASGTIPLLSQPIGYRRDFLIGPGYVAVQTLLAPQAGEPQQETYETLPLYYGVDHIHHHAPGDWGVAVFNGTTPVAAWDLTSVGPGFVTGDRVVVTRYAGTLEITFDQPERIGLADRWAGAAGESRNLLVDLTPTGATFSDRAVRYVMRTY